MESKMTRNTKKAEIGSEVDAKPVKRFFVDMLTRDISLEDAILDLLDNCVDGILRFQKSKSLAKPYAGKWANIEFDSERFVISDNCGGIPWELHPYAWHFGRPKKAGEIPKGSVGVYGIGMKRAIFKMGCSCVISTQSGIDRYDVVIDEDWIKNDAKWEIPVVKETGRMNEDGTIITITKLRPEVASSFTKSSGAFEEDVHKKVSEHYAFIIDKGFRVSINGNTVPSRPTKLIFNESPGKGPRISPYIYKARVTGVDIFLAVGFTRGLPTGEELSQEQIKPQYSAEKAGWTVVCNDRVVVYRNRDELTGWGEANVPRFHNQFIAISGLVEFKSSDPRNLPTTTTKHGIDGDSRLYLKVKNFMRTGMKIFTDYTNKWKLELAESKKHFRNPTELGFEDIKKKAKGLKMRKTTTADIEGKYYKPELPLPKKMPKDQVKISFTKPTKEVRFLASRLFRDNTADPSDVGEKCFDRVYKEFTE